MRRPFIAGNWKMNMDKAGSIALVQGLVQACKDITTVDVAVCPPFVYLDAVCQAAKGSNIAVGAQNCYFEDNGAFTGEISLSMLKDLGCTYVILGHSERRNTIGKGECNCMINKKVKKVLAEGLLPILCIGELLEQRESGKTLETIYNQLDGSLADISADEMQKIVLAYEPVWAIGTGKVATPDQAEEVHAAVRAWLKDKFGAATAEIVRIQYGGSVKAANAKDLVMGKPDIDGALVGGASLKVDAFMGIIENCK